MVGDGGQEEGWVVCRIFKKKNHLKTLDSPLASSIMNGESASRRSHHLFDSCDEGALEQILQQMGRSCKEENEGSNNHSNGRFINIGRPFDVTNNNIDRFLKLPSLESPKSTSMESQQHNHNNSNNNNNGYHPILPPEMVTDNEAAGSFTTSHGVNGADHSNMAHYHHHHHHHHHQMHEAASSSSSMVVVGGGSGGLTNWAALDRLVASQLNGQITCFNVVDPTMSTTYDDHLQLPALRSSSSSSSSPATAAAATTTTRAAPYLSTPATQDYACSEIDLWTFARSTPSLLSSSSEPLCHVSNTSL